MRKVELCPPGTVRLEAGYGPAQEKQNIAVCKRLYVKTKFLLFINKQANKNKQKQKQNKQKQT